MKATLSFLNLLDTQGNLSITNLAVIIVLIKLTINPSSSITEAGTLLIALANYAHKRIVNKSEVKNPVQDKVSEIEKNLEQISSQVSAMAIQSGLRKN